MNKKEFILNSLSEECIEVSMAVSKTLTFGLENGHPLKSTTNAMDLQEEFNHVLAMVEILKETGIIDLKYDEKIIKEKKENFNKKMKIAMECNCLSPHYF